MRFLRRRGVWHAQRFSDQRGAAHISHLVRRRVPAATPNRSVRGWEDDAHHGRQRWREATAAFCEASKLRATFGAPRRCSLQAQSIWREIDRCLLQRAHRRRYEARFAQVLAVFTGQAQVPVINTTSIAERNHMKNVRSEKSSKARVWTAGIAKIACLSYCLDRPFF